MCAGRGHLRADLHQHLRTGRAVRRPRRSTVKGPSGKIPDMILISERPAEVADRAVPGIGKVTSYWGRIAGRRSPPWWNGKADS